MSEISRFATARTARVLFLCAGLLLSSCRLNDILDPHGLRCSQISIEERAAILVRHGPTNNSRTYTNTLGDPIVVTFRDTQGKSIGFSLSQYGPGTGDQVTVSGDLVEVKIFRCPDIDAADTFALAQLRR